MKKSILLITLLTLVLTTNIALAAPLHQEADGEEYIVQADDWLSKIAHKYYDDMFAYPVIVEATNVKAVEDDNFTVIENPDLIEVGQKLWIPDAPLVPSGQAKLSDQVWYWQGYQDATEINDFTVPNPAKYTLEFLPDGTYQVVADCNRGSGSYVEDGSSLTFGPGPMTLAECGPESLYDEFVTRLGDVVTYVFDDGKLVLNLKMDAGNMVFGGEATLSLDVLKNAEYQGIYAEPVELTDGKYEGEPFVEGGASRPTVTFIDPFNAFGDLNGDDFEDAAITLAENSGGSGTFIYLAAVVSQDRSLINVATQFLGDIQLKSLAIESGEIVVTLVTHAPDDPMCCPSQEEIKRYRLQDGALVEQ
ncbi:META domain-containing protein [Anaerolineales bacterium HSG24]|nr:META domain-containing protein [Anaerolineales bacterium HSG24]